MTKLAVECHQLGKVYQEDCQGHNLWAVRDLTLTVEQGSITLLMGPLGSGKTTLLSMIGGLLMPTAGWLTVCGVALENCSEGQRQQFRRSNVGYIFQHYNLLSALTAQENVGIALAMRNLDGSMAEEFLAQVGLSDKADAYPAELSGGQRQRVAIARALAGHTPLLLADEPTAALDSAQGQAVMQMIRYQAKRLGTTALIVTHDPRIVRYADHIIEMEDGTLNRLVAQRAVDRRRPAAVARPRFTAREVSHVGPE